MISDIGTSLWLVPSPDVRDKLRKVIKQLSGRQEPNSPIFEPHITLLSLPPSHSTPIQSLESIKSFPVQFLPVTAGSSYFQSVLIPIEPSDNILECRNSTCLAQNVPSQPYFPHLSLFYGDSTQEGRQEKIDWLYQEGIAQATGSVAGVQGFDVTELWVVKTEGRVEEWEIEKKILLE